MEHADKRWRKRNYLIIIIILLVVILSFLLLSTKQQQVYDNTTVNANLIQIKDFYVTAASTDLKTSATGTVFVRGGEGAAEHIQIVARIEIDPDDWGGVEFSIPDKWRISGIKSSFPENRAHSQPAGDVSTLMTTEPSEWGRARIEIGRAHSYNPTGGGTGTVVIDIVPDRKAEQSESFHIGVAVGSADNGAYKIVGTDSIRVPISLAN